MLDIHEIYYSYAVNRRFNPEKFLESIFFSLISNPNSYLLKYNLWAQIYMLAIFFLSGRVSNFRGRCLWSSYTEL